MLSDSTGGVAGWVAAATEGEELDEDEMSCWWWWLWWCHWSRVRTMASRAGRWRSRSERSANPRARLRLLLAAGTSIWPSLSTCIGSADDGISIKGSPLMAAGVGVCDGEAVSASATQSWPGRRSDASCGAGAGAGCGWAISGSSDARLGISGSDSSSVGRDIVGVVDAADLCVRRTLRRPGGTSAAADAEAE